MCEPGIVSLVPLAMADSAPAGESQGGFGRGRGRGGRSRGRRGGRGRGGAKEAKDVRIIVHSIHSLMVGAEGMTDCLHLTVDSHYQVGPSGQGWKDQATRRHLLVCHAYQSEHLQGGLVACGLF